ncbi:MAG: hypothetical protein DYG92_04205 [Leptolyngbya sp. PLA1]|nr:hypothetical protein [Leptolyngbya sp. PLA1]
MPIPEHQQVPSGSIFDGLSIRAVALPVTVVAAGCWSIDEPEAVAARSSPPAFTDSGQGRALRATRLRI